MADIPLPRYNLPPAALPAGLDVAAAVPPNPLAGIGPGINQGATLGFQSRQTAALEQERQTQLMQAQVAAQQAKRENDLKALDVVGNQYERIAKHHPDTAFEYYHSTMAPLFSSVLADHGLHADFQSEANPVHETADSVKRIHDAVTGLSDGSIDMPTFQKIMNREQSGHNVGDYLQKRIDEATKSGNAIQENTKNQENMEKGVTEEYNRQLQGRGPLGTQDAKVNQAVHLRSLINDRSRIDPKTGEITYDLPENLQEELVIGLGNLMSGGNASNMEELKNLTPKTSSGDFKHIASYWTNTPLNISPQAFQKILVDSIDRQGQVSQQLRDTYHEQFKKGVPIDLEPQRVERATTAGRGARFDDYLPGGKFAPKQKQNASTPEEEYLQSIGAKITPANIRWAQSKTGKK